MKRGLIAMAGMVGLCTLLALVGCRSASLMSVNFAIPKGCDGAPLQPLVVSLAMYNCETNIGQGKSVPVEVSPGRGISAAIQADGNVVPVGGGTGTLSDSSAGKAPVVTSGLDQGGSGEKAKLTEATAGEESPVAQ